jgi:hypothetical protein
MSSDPQPETPDAAALARELAETVQNATSGWMCASLERDQRKKAVDQLKAFQMAWSFIPLEMRLQAMRALKKFDPRMYRDLCDAVRTDLETR